MSYPTPTTPTTNPPTINNSSTTKIPAPPLRPKDSHKGTFGTVIIIGGSQTMPGAVAIAARAAFRTGSGLVKIASDKDTLKTSLTIEPSATGIALDCASKQIINILDKEDPEKKAVLAIGPGLGQDDKHIALLKNILKQERPIVLDADGLNLLAKSKLQCNSCNAKLVLTPHLGEFARLASAAGIATPNGANQTQRIQVASELAKYHSAVVVLKGNRTVVSDGENVFVNNTGNPAMATAGSGDVLTGAVASLIGQNMDIYSAAVLAVNIHGQAGDIWAKENGPSGLLARQLADNLVLAMEERRKTSKEPRK